MAEYLRAGLEEGWLSASGQSASARTEQDLAVPSADSIEQLIRRRLAGLTTTTRQVLEAAAAIGNPIPASLLSAVCQLGNAELEAHVTQLVELNYLERGDSQSWRFLHDKLREVCYEAIDPEAVIPIHRDVGLSLERTVLTESSRLSLAPVLAHHFAKARDTARAVAYLDQAAEIAHQSFANRDVIALLAQAREIAGGSGVDEQRSAGWHYRLANAYFGLGLLAESNSHLVLALRLLGLRAPRTALTSVLSCVVEIARQLVHRIFPLRTCAPEKRRQLLDAASAYDTRMQILFYAGSDLFGMLHSTLANLNLSELGGPSPELRLAYANAQSTAALLGFNRLAGLYERIAETEMSADDRTGLQTAATVRQCTEYVITGQWGRATFLATQVIERAREAHYARREEEGMALLAYTHFAVGRFREAQELADALHQSSSRGDVQSFCWSAVFQGYGYLVLDRPHLAFEAATSGLVVVAGLPGRSEAINLNTIAAFASLRLGNLQDALAHASTALELGRKVGLMVFLDIVPYSYLAQTFLTLGGPGVLGGLPTVSAQARAALHQLELCARVFPIARPRLALWKGIFHWRSARARRANACWMKAGRLARSLEMPFEAAYADLLLGLNAPSRGEKEAAIYKAAHAMRGLGASFDEQAVLALSAAKELPLGSISALVKPLG